MRPDTETRLGAALTVLALAASLVVLLCVVGALIAT